MLLTPTELKEIRAVMCRMAEDGRSADQIEGARKTLHVQFAALKEATAKPGATAK
jgi:hypothetical protein